MTYNEICERIHIGVHELKKKGLNNLEVIVSRDIFEIIQQHLEVTVVARKGSRGPIDYRIVGMDITIDEHRKNVIKVVEVESCAM